MILILQGSFNWPKKAHGTWTARGRPTRQSYWRLGGGGYRGSEIYVLKPFGNGAMAESGPSWNPRWQCSCSLTPFRKMRMSPDSSQREFTRSDFILFILAATITTLGVRWQGTSGISLNSWMLLKSWRKPRTRT